MAHHAQRKNMEANFNPTSLETLEADLAKLEKQRVAVLAMKDNQLIKGGNGEGANAWGVVFVVLALLGFLIFPLAPIPMIIIAILCFIVGASNGSSYRSRAASERELRLAQIDREIAVKERQIDRQYRPS